MSRTQPALFENTDKLIDELHQLSGHRFPSDGIVTQEFLDECKIPFTNCDPAKFKENHDLVDEFFANQIRVCNLDMDHEYSVRKSSLLMSLASRGLVKSTKAALEKGADIHKKDKEKKHSSACRSSKRAR